MSKSFHHKSKFEDCAPVPCGRLRAVDGNYYCLSYSHNLTTNELREQLADQRNASCSFGSPAILFLCPYRRKDIVNSLHSGSDAHLFKVNEVKPIHFVIRDSSGEEEGWCEPFFWNGVFWSNTR